MAVSLTSLSHGARCGCKLPAAAIGPLLAALGTTATGRSDPNVLVGFAGSDDAGVYRVRSDLAIVQTGDFFTPIVDDPFRFGQIAAANALSDIYAMGAEPVSALILVAFSIEPLGAEVLAEILRGGPKRPPGAAGAHGLTDVTGFGLLGHLHELALASGVAADLRAAAIPAIDGVLALLGRDDEAAVAGGTRRNRAGAERFARFDPGVDEARRWLATDAMTSGGLLAAVPGERADAVPGAVIGRLVDGVPGAITVISG